MCTFRSGPVTTVIMIIMIIMWVQILIERQRKLKAQSRMYNP